MAKAPLARKPVAQNRKARHDYLISDTFEAGLVLTGTEVKSCRGGGVQLVDSYADPSGGELWLVNAHIGPYSVPLYRDTVLKDIRKQYYAMPYWLPKGPCYMDERYGAITP